MSKLPDPKPRHRRKPPPPVPREGRPMCLLGKAVAAVILAYIAAMIISMAAA